MKQCQGMGMHPDTRRVSGCIPGFPGPGIPGPGCRPAESPSPSHSDCRAGPPLQVNHDAGRRSPAAARAQPGGRSVPGLDSATRRAGRPPGRLSAGGSPGAAARPGGLSPSRHHGRDRIGWPPPGPAAAGPGPGPVRRPGLTVGDHSDSVTCCHCHGVTTGRPGTQWHGVRPNSKHPIIMTVTVQHGGWTRRPAPVHRRKRNVGVKRRAYFMPASST